MTGTKKALAPLGTVIELDANEVADLAVDAVADRSQQFSVWTCDLDGSVERDLPVKLEASSRFRDVFKVCYSAAATACVVFPHHLNEVGTQHSRLNTPFQHVYLIGDDRLKD